MYFFFQIYFVYKLNYFSFYKFSFILNFQSRDYKKFFGFERKKKKEINTYWIA